MPTHLLRVRAVAALIVPHPVQIRTCTLPHYSNPNNYLIEYYTGYLPKIIISAVRPVFSTSPRARGDHSCFGHVFKPDSRIVGGCRSRRLPSLGEDAVYTASCVPTQAFPFNWPSLHDRKHNRAQCSGNQVGSYFLDSSLFPLLPLPTLACIVIHPGHTCV